MGIPYYEHACLDCVVYRVVKQQTTHGDPALSFQIDGDAYRSLREKDCGVSESYL